MTNEADPSVECRASKISAPRQLLSRTGITHLSPAIKRPAHVPRRFRTLGRRDFQGVRLHIAYLTQCESKPKCNTNDRKGRKSDRKQRVGRISRPPFHDGTSLRPQNRELHKPPLQPTQVKYFRVGISVYIDQLGTPVYLLRIVLYHLPSASPKCPFFPIPRTSQVPTDA